MLLLLLLLLLVCLFMIGLAFAKEDYDFDVEAKNVNASVWGRVSYTDNTSIFPVIKDIIDYNIHLTGQDKNLITTSNVAILEMNTYKGSTEKSTKKYECIKEMKT